MNFLILGQSVGKEKKNKLKIWRSLELDGLVHVPENNICGAWKRQDEVTKSTWQHWGKERSTSWLNSNMNSEKKDDKTLTVLQIKVTMF